MENSDTAGILVVSGLVEGVYNFTLTVTNRNNLSATDTVMVTVFPSPMLRYMLQLVLEVDRVASNSTNSFTVTDKVCVFAFVCVCVFVCVYLLYSNDSILLCSINWSES